MTTIQALEPGEFEQLLEEVEALPHNAQRDALALCLMHDLAGRIGDVVNARAEDVSDDQCYFRFWNGKKRKANEYDTLPISTRTAERLNRYLAVRTPGETLLTTSTGQAVTDSHYRRLLRRLGPRVLGKHVYPHLLRHTQLTDAACGTPTKPALPMPIVQKLGRHKSLRTTEKYIHVRPSWGDDVRLWMAE